MRDCSAELAADLELGCTTLAHLLVIEREDGVILRFTDASTDLVVGGDTYSCDPGFTTSAVFTSASATMGQNLTLTMPMSAAALTEADVRSKRYTRAEVSLSVVNYADTTHGTMALFSGNFGSIRLTDKKALSIEVVPQGASLGSAVLGSEVYASTCRNSLGDSRCQVDLDAISLEFVVDNTSGLSFVALELTTEADEWFTQGFVEWTAGDNAGLKSMVAKSVQSTQTITLVQAPPNPIQDGDEGTLVPGCDKLPVTCHTKFANILNFNGEPHVPSEAIIMPIETKVQRGPRG